MEAGNDHVHLFVSIPPKYSVGDKVTSEVIKKYISYHRHSETQPDQLELF